MGPLQTCGGVVVVVTGPMVWVVRAAWAYLGLFGGYFEYMRAVPEYMLGHGSSWASEMGK